MLLSTAIPIVIAAMVIVIISNGIPSSPIIPRIKKAAIKFGTTPIRDNLIFLKSIKNIINIPAITKPRVRIWDLNKLWSKLLNKIKTPASLNSLFLLGFVLSIVLADLLRFIDQYYYSSVYVKICAVVIYSFGYLLAYARLTFLAKEKKESYISFSKSKPLKVKEE